MNLLLCTLGQSWAVIPEVFALLDPRRCPLYRDHPNRAAIDELRRHHRLGPVDELWVCTTDDRGLDEGLDRLHRWRDRIDADLRLRIWRTAEVSDVADQAAGERVRELIYRAVLLAAEQKGKTGRLYLSLAGGRKTMSADLQRAGMVIGCDALLHVIAPPTGRMSETMKTAAPETFTAPLASGDCRGLLPLVIGQGHRSDLLDIVDESGARVNSERFTLPLPEDGVPHEWAVAVEESLPEEIERREREGGRLLGNYLRALATSERHENWRSLYRLPPATIEWLRDTPLTGKHRDWLVNLPKADLHRHIGGCLDLDAQRRVGRAIWEEMTRRERAAALDCVRPLLEGGAWDWHWPSELERSGERSHNVAALLVEAGNEQLQRNLYGVTEPRRGLQSHEHGFSAYERPGELSGSAVLRHPAALEPYIASMLDAARAEGLTYLELRGSPQKYRDGQDQQIDFLEQIRRIAERYDDIMLRFIVIADRRRPDDLPATVQLAVRGRDRLGGFVAGLDLAGDEKKDTDQSLDEIARAFEPAFRECLPITIHAGEGTEPEKIWDAAYRLHADRVGHGLTLKDNERLLQRFRDRGICVELCPTSNDEVVGYGDGRTYPLRGYWERGVPLAICTDNPGISRTDAAGELIKAAEFWPELRLWDVLGIVKQGFVHAFLPADEREKRLKEADLRVLEQVMDLSPA